jgi:hypothetical protein
MQHSHNFCEAVRHTAIRSNARHILTICLFAPQDLDVEHGLLDVERANATKLCHKSCRVVRWPSPAYLSGQGQPKTNAQSGNDGMHQSLDMHCRLASQ